MAGVCECPSPQAPSVRSGSSSKASAVPSGPQVGTFGAAEGGSSPWTPPCSDAVAAAVNVPLEARGKQANGAAKASKGNEPTHKKARKNAVANKKTLKQSSSVMKTGEDIPCVELDED